VIDVQASQDDDDAELDAIMKAAADGQETEFQEGDSPPRLVKRSGEHQSVGQQQESDEPNLSQSTIGPNTRVSITAQPLHQSKRLRAQ